MPLASGQLVNQSRLIGFGNVVKEIIKHLRAFKVLKKSF